MSANKSSVQFDTDHESSRGISTPMAQVANKRHPEFYFDDSLVVIQVEDTLFRVHKFQLVKSETFSDMFNMPKGPTKPLEEGASPEYPIVLDGVKASDFAALLKVLYAFHFSDEKPKCEPEMIVPAFRLAHMWNFAKLRTHLLPLVKDSLGCVEKIVLAREVGLQEWLLPAHVELCQREEPLTREEGTQLGMDSTILISRLREQFRPSQSVPSSGCFWNYCDGCGGHAPIVNKVIRGVANCYRCGTHINSGTNHYRFPVTPPGATPNSRHVWNYCISCGSSEPTRAHREEADCHKCGTHIRSGTWYFHFTATASSTALLGSNVELESQVKEWVEAGCVTE